MHVRRRLPQGRKADLVPVFLAAADGRCNWDGYHLRFGVKNTGNAAAGRIPGFSMPTTLSA